MKRYAILVAVCILAVGPGCNNSVENPMRPETLSLTGVDARMSSLSTAAALMPAGSQAADFGVETEAGEFAEAMQSDEPELGRLGSGRTIKVPDHYPTIQAAVDAANPGDNIQVRASGSPYNEVVTIPRSKTGIRVSAKGEVTLNGRFLVLADNVHIRNFRIFLNVPTSWGAIHFHSVSGGKATDNVLIDTPASVTGRGVTLYRSTDCIVKNNSCTGFRLNGIGLFYSNRNTITRNVCTGSSSGIMVVSSDENLISKNNCSDNLSIGISLNNSSDHNQVRRNVCERNGYAGIHLVSNYNTIGPNNKANQNSQFGILLGGDADFNVVRRNEFQCNGNRDILDLGELFNSADNQIFKNKTGCENGEALIADVD